MATYRGGAVDAAYYGGYDVLRVPDPTMRCPSCGHDNLQEARFCGGCGAPLSPPPAPESPATTPSAAPAQPRVAYAGFGLRFLALLIDAVIVFAALFLLQAVLAGLFLASGFGVFGAADFVFALGFLLFPPAYFVVLTGLWGQTVGKMALGVRVVDAQGRVPGIGRALLREVVGKFLSSIVIYLGFLWVAWDRRKQGWHDKLAGSVAVRTRGRTGAGVAREMSS